jgi:hypothetical protein
MRRWIVMTAAALMVLSLAGWPALAGRDAPRKDPGRSVEKDEAASVAKFFNSLTPEQRRLLGSLLQEGAGKEAVKPVPPKRDEGKVVRPEVKRDVERPAAKPDLGVRGRRPAWPEVGRAGRGARGGRGPAAQAAPRGPMGGLQASPGRAWGGPGQAWGGRGGAAPGPRGMRAAPGQAWGPRGGQFGRGPMGPGLGLGQGRGMGPMARQAPQTRQPLLDQLRALRPADRQGVGERGIAATLQECVKLLRELVAERRGAVARPQPPAARPQPPAVQPERRRPAAPAQPPAVRPEAPQRTPVQRPFAQFGEAWTALTPDQQAAVRERLSKMTPEERQALMTRLGNTTPEQRAQMLKRLAGAVERPAPRAEEAPLRPGRGLGPRGGGRGPGGPFGGI